MVTPSPKLVAFLRPAVQLSEFLGRLVRSSAGISLVSMPILDLSDCTRRLSSQVGAQSAEKVGAQS